MTKVIPLEPWEVHQFPWGSAVRHRNGKWTNVILSNGQDVDVSEMNVIIHENGIEFTQLKGD